MLASLMRAEGTTGNDRRQPATKLDRETIIATALSLVEREGAEAVTMRRLGAELGADPTAVYRHFRNKQALLDAMADDLFSHSLDLVQPTGDWREDLYELALAGFRLYRQHTAFALQLARQPEELPALARIAELTIGPLRVAGLTDHDAAVAYHSLIDTIAGAGLFHALTSALSTPARRAATRRTYAALAPETHPNVVAVSRHLFPDDEVVFRFTVERLLDSIELRATRTPTKEEHE